MSKKIAFSMSRDEDGCYHFSTSIPGDVMAAVVNGTLDVLPEYLDKLAEALPELAMHITLMKQSVGMNNPPSKEREPS